jgi:predicted RNA-binding protein YlxR (DUF448 family)
MRFCPKCRTFTDDELLRFCKNDGIPLISIDQTNKLWSKGAEYVREANQTIRREIRRSQIKKIVSMLVTTVVVTSVISVIILNSWMYTHPNEVAEILGEKKKEIVAQSTPIVAETPLVLESTPLTRLPETERTPTANKPSVKITPKTEESPKIIEPPANADTSANNSRKVKTVKNTNTNNIGSSQPVETCSASDQQRFADEIKRSYASFWKQKILSQENRLFEKYLKDQKLRNGAQLSVFQNGITVRVDNKCETATATVPIAWTVYSSAQAFLSEVKTVNGSEVFICNKGKIWSCS